MATSSGAVRVTFSHLSTKRRLSPATFLSMRPGLMDRRSGLESQEGLDGSSIDRSTDDERGATEESLYKISNSVRVVPSPRDTSGERGHPVVEPTTGPS